MDASHGFADAPFPEGMVEEIAAFLAADHLRPSGKDLYPEVFGTQFFFPLQRQQELAAMIRLARSINPQTVMEIGADKGGGLYHWCKCLPSVDRVIAFEIRGTPYRRLFEDAFARQIEFFWGEGDSQHPEAVRALRYWLEPSTLPKIDVLFIDGDKLLMEQDFDAYLPLMDPKGLVFFHDVQDRQPREAYWRVRDRGYAGEVVVNTEDSHRAMRREADGVPPADAHEGWLRHWKGRSCGVGVVKLGERERGTTVNVFSG